MILLTVLLAMLLMALLPPVNTVSYYYSGETVKINPIIRYEFLFSKLCKEINYSRLLLQYLIVLIAGTWFVLYRRQADASLAKRVTKLSASNYNLQQYVTEGNHEAEQLKQKTAELTAAKEKLGRQVNELKYSEQKWHICRDKLEQNVNERLSELSKAKSQLEQQIAERRQIEERLNCQNNELKVTCERLQQQMRNLQQAEEIFNKQAAELAVVNEQLQQQTRERENAERQLREFQKRLEQQTVQLASVRLRGKIDRSEWPEAENDELLEQPKLKIEPLDLKKIKELAELAKRLS